MYNSKRNLSLPLLAGAFAIVGILVIVLVVGCGKPGSQQVDPNNLERVRVAYLPIIPDLPVFVANDEGLFKKHGLDPQLNKIAGSGNQVIEALSRGDADLSYLAFSTILEADQQAPGSFVVLQHNVDSREYPSLYSLVSSSKSGIQKVSDFRGRVIGTFPGSAMLVLTKLMLGSAGLDAPKDVKIVQLAPPAQVAALQTGQVDGLLALEPNAAFAVNAGAGTIIDRWPLTPSVATTLLTGGSVVLKKTADTRPEYTRKIVAALDDAIDFIRLHPEKAAQYYAKYCDVPPQVAQTLPVLHYWKSSEINVPVSQDFADLLTREKVLESHRDVRSLYRSTQ